MITLEANYSKKIGLPGYSSHQFSVTLKSELTDIAQAEKESARLYDVLQQSVDRNIQQVGFLPGEPAKTNGNGHQYGHGHPCRRWRAQNHRATTSSETSFARDRG